MEGSLRVRRMELLERLELLEQIDLVGALKIHPYPKIVKIIRALDKHFAAPSGGFSHHADLALLPRDGEEPLVTAVDLLSHRAQQMRQGAAVADAALTAAVVDAIMLQTLDVGGAVVKTDDPIEEQFYRWVGRILTAKLSPAHIRAI